MSQAEVERLTTWPAEIPRSDLGAFFVLADEDLRWLRRHTVAANRIGLAARLCALRYLGTVPENFSSAPAEAIAMLCHQLDTSPAEFAKYEARIDERTRRRHIESVLTHADWSVCDAGEWKRLGDWLVERALEHDIPAVLFRSAVDFLHSERIVRPGLDRLSRAIGAARVEANAELHQRVQRQLQPPLRDALDALVETDTQLGIAPLVWLGTQATTASPSAIAEEIAKLEEGAVDLDAPASDYITRVELGTAGTVRDLLQHTSGNYDRGGPTELFGDPSRVWSASDITEAWLTTSPREPGSGFTYASSNYLLLGLLIEEVTGDSYAAAVRERVIEPAGLLNTYVAHFELGPVPFDPFIQRGQDSENYTSIATASWSAGAIVSSAKDLHAMFSALFRHELLSAPTVEMMTAGTGYDLRVDYGLGLQLLGDDLVGHDGFTPGIRQWHFTHPRPA